MKLVLVLGSCIVFASLSSYAMNFLNREAKLEYLHKLVKTENVEDPLIFAQIETLSDHLGLTDQFPNIVRNYNFWGEQVFNVDYKKAHAILKTAIEKNQPKVVTLLYRRLPGKTITLVEQCHNLMRQNQYAYPQNCKTIQTLPTDFEILANVAKDHADPLGMAQFLQSFRDPKEVPFEGKVPTECTKATPNNPKFNNFCKYLEDAIANHSARLHKQFEEALEKEARQKKE